MNVEVHVVTLEFDLICLICVIFEMFSQSRRHTKTDYDDNKFKFGASDIKS